MRIKPATKDELATKAQFALAQVEKLTVEIETATKMNYTSWRDYGQALLEKRKLVPDTRKFNAWLREHHLNTGLAKRPEVRSNAMWLARDWDDVQACKGWLEHGQRHHPTDIRRAWLARKVAVARDERALLNGLEQEISGPLRDLLFGIGCAQSVADEIQREHSVTGGNVRSLLEDGKVIADALARIEKWAAENASELVPDRRPTYE